MQDRMITVLYNTWKQWIPQNYDIYLKISWCPNKGNTYLDTADRNFSTVS